MSYPDLECTCNDCVEKHNQEHMDKYGFYVEYNFFSDSDYVDFHTVGLEENYGHPEFQIVLPVSVDFADFVFHCIAARIYEHREDKDNHDLILNSGFLLNLDYDDRDNIYNVRIFDNVPVEILECYCQYNDEWFVRVLFVNPQEQWNKYLKNDSKVDKFNKMYEGQRYV